MDLLNENRKKMIEEKPEKSTMHDDTHGRKRGVLLIDIHQEKIQVEDKEDFARKLVCSEDENLKVVSIFGNTGDGKSYTLNHTFFSGQEVFSTSASQTSCTVGIWAAYDEKNHLLIVDTEGLLSTSNNSNQRKRLLMKILAISDVIIYRTKAERLHSDMFSFLGDASKAYLRHFSPELKAAIERSQLNLPICLLGPAVVIFHETHHTEILGTQSNDLGETKSADELLKQRFAAVKQDPQAFSSIKYVGTKTLNHSTDFQALFKTVIELTNDLSVRSRRPLGVIYDVLNHLNEKFKGEIENVVPDTFPDSYFTCLTICQCCSTRCEGTMNHGRDGTAHKSEKSCHYMTQFDNRYFTCNACYQRGKNNIVTEKTYADGDGSLKGLANYAWSGYVLECPECGVIYRSRQYWYGNTEPEKTVVRTHLKHVWQGEHYGDVNHTGRRVLDGLNFVKRTVDVVSEVPSRYIKDLLSDAIAPGYWVSNNEIKECYGCKHIFESSEAKHHCRACGQGFCHDCSDFVMPVPDRGWGPGPVKVCKTCFLQSETKSEDDEIFEGELVDTSALSEALDEDDQHSGKDDLRARKVGEVLHSSVSKLAQVVDLPRTLINDVARPSYWVADADIVTCACCDYKFRIVDSKHHCRACGQGVCGRCSTKMQAVPVRGWDHPVRVCDSCLEDK
ncbi:zinc finger FYVE domain-containing protein 1-like [Dendronephthya gigantea]|uniref:zinc finger FYVE domain-containing protein 1-like n=1 Tax=Dendronephthya gigantea TaxID=151771 RepID=UPI00106B503E|nr:zinc finger FYVE domain-containing protein 1-like [Dendronephthya gigantea]